MMIAKNKAYVLFDGECGICTAFADWAQRLDRQKKFEIVPYQNFSEADLHRAGTSPERCARRMHVISRHGKIYTGAFAVNFFLGHFMPYALLVGLLYIIPVFLLIEIAVYALVAKHRRRISQWLGLQACAVAANMRPEA